MEFEVENGGAEGFCVEARGGESGNGGWELGRQEPGGVPPGHFGVADGAETKGFGGGEGGLAAGAGGWQDGA